MLSNEKLSSMHKWQKQKLLSHLNFYARKFFT